MVHPQLPLHVDVLGPEPGPDRDTFILLHGYGASGFTWRYWAPRLAELGHVVRLDLKGFGRAPRPADDRYSPSDQARLVIQLIRARDLRAVTVVGHSLGGGVALLVALGLNGDARHRLRRLVLVSGAAYPQRLPPFVRMADWPKLSSLLLKLAGMRRVVAGALRMAVYDPADVSNDQIEGYAEPLASADAVRALLAAAKQVVPPDLDALTSRYREIDVPALLLWGREDPVVPLSTGQRLVRDLRDARLRILERCGHLPHEERPTESFTILRDFLNDT